MADENEHILSFRVTDISGAACSMSLEQYLAGLPGVKFASVNRQTECAFALTDKSVSFEMIAAAADNCGCTLLQDAASASAESRRSDMFFVAASVVLLTILTMMQTFSSSVFVWYGCLEVLASTAAVFWGGRKVLRSGLNSLLHGCPNLDSLAAVSVIAAWITAVMHFFDAAPSFVLAGVFALMLHLSGRCLDMSMRGKTVGRLNALLKLQTREARLLAAGGEEIMVPAAAVKPGSRILVGVGETIPIDGVVVNGASRVDESLLTGESLPVVKDVGSTVSVGAVNLSGRLTIETAGAGCDGCLSKAPDRPCGDGAEAEPIHDEADLIALRFLPAVVIFAVLSALCWYFFYDSMLAAAMQMSTHLPWPVLLAPRLNASIAALLATLVIAYPCALGLAVPLSLSSCAEEAAHRDLLFSKPEAAEALLEAEYAVLDKTGTLTQGKLEVVSADADDEACSYVMALEANSNHQLAAAITSFINKKQSAGQVKIKDCGSPQRKTEPPDGGVCGSWGDDEWYLGQPRRCLFSKGSQRAKSSLVEVRKNGVSKGFFAVSDSLRADSRDAVTGLVALGITPVLATGDNMDAAIAVGQAAGIDGISWEAKAADKLALVMAEQSRGKRVLAAGDGLNDAAALRQADTGVAMGSGIGQAIESADIVILKGGLSKIVTAVKILKKTRVVRRQNLFGACIFDVLIIPLAAAGLLHPLAAAAAMAAVTLAVFLNSQRIAGAGVRE